MIPTTGSKGASANEARRERRVSFRQAVAPWAARLILGVSVVILALSNANVTAATPATTARSDGQRVVVDIRLDIAFTDGAKDVGGKEALNYALHLYRDGKYVEALSGLKKLANKNPQGEFADDAVYYVFLFQLDVAKDLNEAYGTYVKLKTLYPQRRYHHRARKELIERLLSRKLRRTRTETVSRFLLPYDGPDEGDSAQSEARKLFANEKARKDGVQQAAMIFAGTLMKDETFDLLTKLCGSVDTLRKRPPSGGDNNSRQQTPLRATQDVLFDLARKQTKAHPIEGPTVTNVTSRRPEVNLPRTVYDYEVSYLRRFTIDYTPQEVYAALGILHLQ